MSNLCSALYKSYLVFPRSQDGIVTVGYIVEQIAFSILALIIIILSCYWLYSRQQHINKGNIHEANTSFLRVYRRVIMIYIFIMSMQLVSIIFYVSMLPFDHVSDSILYSLMYTLPLYQYIYFLFLFSKNTLSQRAFYRAILISLPFSIICYLFEVLTFFDEYLQFGSMALIIMYGTVLLCCFLLLFRQCTYHWKRRQIINRYVFFLILISMLNVSIKVLSFSGYETLCVEQFSFYIWYSIYPLLLFKTITGDSIYWWTTASQPLLESTKMSIAGIDLFTLPPYHDMHFIRKRKRKYSDNHELQTVREEDEELNQRLNKLSQIVSSQVNMIPFKQIKIRDGDVGKGATAKVYRAQWKKHHVAVKRLCSINWTDLTLIFRESILSSTICHENIVLFHGVSVSVDSFYLIYEYCAFGDLQKIIVEDSHPDNPNIKSIYQRLFYLFDIAKGMEFLHQHKFIHRDLKTANVVVTKSRSRYIAKICDFGVSRRMHQDIQDIDIGEKGNEDNEDDTCIVDIIDQQSSSELEINVNLKEIERTIDVGTPAFLAPEILLKLMKKKGVKLSGDNKSSCIDPLILCDYKTDVFSYGIILYSLITSKLPYKGYKAMDMVLMIKRAKRLQVPINDWNKWKPYVSDIQHLKLLLNSTWSQHGKHRPSFTQICQLLNELAHAQFA